MKNKFQDSIIKTGLVIATALVTASLMPFFTAIIGFVVVLGLFHIFHVSNPIVGIMITFLIEAIFIGLILKRKNLGRKIPKYIYAGFGLGMVMILYIFSIK